MDKREEITLDAMKDKIRETKATTGSMENAASVIGVSAKYLYGVLRLRDVTVSNTIAEYSIHIPTGTATAWTRSPQHDRHCSTEQLSSD
jgi:hypothetical protein